MDEKIVEAAKSEEQVSEIMEANMGLVYHVARRFIGRGTEYDDLVQIGSIGLLRAVRCFDPSLGYAFSTYAVPLIIGEIRRFLRDDGSVKVGRLLKQRAAQLLSLREEILQKTGYEAHLDELAESCGLSLSEAAEALSASQAIRSLEEPTGEDRERTLENSVAAEDPLEKGLETLALKDAIGQLPILWRKILVLRYYREKTQAETAALLGLTQVKISREEKKIFSFLRQQLGTF